MILPPIKVTKQVSTYAGNLACVEGMKMIKSWQGAEGTCLDDLKQRKRVAEFHHVVNLRVSFIRQARWCLSLSSLRNLSICLFSLQVTVGRRNVPKGRVWNPMEQSK